MKCISIIVAMVLLAAASVAQDREKLDRIQQSLKDDVPRILCLDERVATGGQPTEAAFAKLASNGYRAVLNLRTAQEGVDLEREKQLVEKAGMRYINTGCRERAETRAGGRVHQSSEGNGEPADADSLRQRESSRRFLDDLSRSRAGLAGRKGARRGDPNRIEKP